MAGTYSAVLIEAYSAFNSKACSGKYLRSGIQVWCLSVISLNEYRFV